MQQKFPSTQIDLTHIGNISGKIALLLAGSDSSL
jgi:hypothetical protein